MPLSLFFQKKKPEKRLFLKNTSLGKPRRKGSILGAPRGLFSKFQNPAQAHRKRHLEITIFLLFCISKTSRFKPAFESRTAENHQSEKRKKIAYL